MSDEQQILPCVQCHQHHEQMLMLSCLHDPCINCAAINYVENCPKNSLYYSCSKCREETQLDSSSVVQLQKVYRSIKPVQQTRDSRKEQGKKFQYNRSIPKVSRQIPNSYQPPQYKPEPSYKNSELPYKNPTQYAYKPQKIQTQYTQPQSYQPISPISPISPSAFEMNRRNMSLMCSQHPEDELSYFCFSCNRPICPECAIHGSHREHEVQTSRRAIALIKERLGQANQNLTVEIGNLNHKKNQSRQHIASLTESNKRDQDMLKKQFARLRTMLAQKQDEFLRAVSDNYQRNCQQARHYADVMEKLIKSYTLVRQSIDATLKKDDLTVLNEFSKKEKQAQQIILQNSQTSQQSRIKNNKIINYNLFEDEVNQLSGILQGMKLTLSTNNTQY